MIATSKSESEIHSTSETGSITEQETQRKRTTSDAQPFNWQTAELMSSEKTIAPLYKAHAGSAAFSSVGWLLLRTLRLGMYVVWSILPRTWKAPMYVVNANLTRPKPDADLTESKTDKENNRPHVQMVATV